MLEVTDFRESLFFCAKHTLKPFPPGFGAVLRGEESCSAEVSEP